MSTLADLRDIRAIDVRLEKDRFYVMLDDGREVGIPYSWYWRLNAATSTERSNWRFIGGGVGIHWEDLDEDLSVSGLLLGEKNPTAPKNHVE